MKRTMPRQKPGKSEQEVRTPREFLAAVERRFGPIRFDLAANASNQVTSDTRAFFGPGSQHGTDALTESWQRPGVLFCNPPFGLIKRWVETAAKEGALGARVHMLLPASLSSRWFSEHVHKKALVLALCPRLRFVGHTADFPKDLVLAVYGPWVAPGFDVWRWKAAA